MSQEIKIASGTDIIENRDRLGRLADLYCKVYNAREPWGLSYSPEQVIDEHEEDLSYKEGVLPVIAYYEEDGHILAYTLGLVGGKKLIPQINKILESAQYFGRVVTYPEKELAEFWHKVTPHIGDNKLLFIYDTIRDEEQEVVKVWLQTGIDVCEFALSQGTAQFVGVTLKETQIYKILEQMRVITILHTTRPSKSLIRPVLVYSNNLRKVSRVFKVAAKMI